MYVSVKHNMCCAVAQLCQTFVTPWNAACQVLVSMGIPRQECWSKLPFPTPGDLLDPGIEPASLMYPALTALVLPGKLMLAIVY